MNSICTSIIPHLDANRRGLEVGTQCSPINGKKRRRPMMGLTCVLINIAKKHRTGKIDGQIHPYDQEFEDQRKWIFGMNVV